MKTTPKPTGSAPQAYAGVAKFDEADEDIQKSISINADDYETYLAQASVLLAEKKYAEAVQALDDAIGHYKPKKPDSDEPFSQGYLTKAAALLEAAKETKDRKRKGPALRAGAGRVRSAAPDRG